MSEVQMHSIEKFTVLRLGRFKRPDQIWSSLKKKCTVSVWAGQLINQLSKNRKSFELEVGIISVADAGFPDGASMLDFFARVETLGGRLLPPFAAPMLRACYDQPDGDRLCVAMNPLPDVSGRPSLFVLEAFPVGRQHLSACLYGDVFLSPDTVFVFELKQKN